MRAIRLAALESVGIEEARFRAYLDPHDWWMGLYWRHEARSTRDIDGYMFPYEHDVCPLLRVYACPLPCCVLSLKVQFRRKP